MFPALQYPPLYNILHPTGLFLNFLIYLYDLHHSLPSSPVSFLLDGPYRYDPSYSPPDARYIAENGTYVTLLRMKRCINNISYLLFILPPHSFFKNLNPNLFNDLFTPHSLPFSPHSSPFSPHPSPLILHSSHSAVRSMGTSRAVHHISGFR